MKSLKLVILVLLLSYSNMNLSQKYDLKNLMGIDDSHIAGDTIMLEQNTLIAFNKMHEAALEDGIDIKIVSGFRDFKRQMLIWDNKYKKYTAEYKLSPTKAIEEIIRFSTVPGTSRHHWGTEIDIIDASDEKYKEIIISKIPSARLGEPEDIANAVLFLASDQSDYVNGETLHVNGGMYMA